MFRYMLLLTAFLLSSVSNGAEPEPLILNVGANQQYKTIQSAIDASNQAYEAIIFVASGTYDEKLFITRNRLSIIGQSAESTIIRSAILREHWREKHPSDWGAAVVNINATDINLINLTILNDYGRRHGTNEHQFAVRGFAQSDRIITHNCRLIADGADTLSLWNKHGQYYHSHCYFEGATDFVCPRGSALIEHSQFYNTKKHATIWHDGELDPDYKLVVNHSEFDGIEGFWLGRHHYDAQFYLLNSTFSENMADKPIFKKRYNNKGKERPNLYGARYFFENVQSASSYDWMVENFRLSDVIPKQHRDLQDWVFKGQWRPTQTLEKLQDVISRYSTMNIRPVSI